VVFFSLPRFLLREHVCIINFYGLNFDFIICNFQVAVLNDSLDLTVMAPNGEEMRGKTEGLLGNNDNDATNDFVMKNQTMLANTSTEEELYVFADSCKFTLCVLCFSFVVLLFC